MTPNKEKLLASSLDMLDLEWGPFMGSLSRDDAAFVRERLFRLPRPIQHSLLEKYSQLKSGFAANTYLRTVTDELFQILPPLAIKHFDDDEQSLRDLASNCASLCEETGMPVKPLTSRSALPIAIKKLVIPVNGIKSVNGLESGQEQIVFNLCSKVVNEFGLNPPQIEKPVTLTGAIRRMQDRNWWMKKLRKRFNQAREQAMRIIGKVNARYGKYCSDLTVSNRQSQKQSQLMRLDNIRLTNEFGDSFSLREIYEMGVSNPVNRRNELMTRMKGLENQAKTLGLSGMFITITCPSKFHSHYAKSGDRNPKWNGSTPYDAQQYLNSVWQRIRAEFNRRDIKQCGMRVVEPQHDGTPHWHLLMFYAPEHRDELMDVYSHYALLEDGDEPGAALNRCDFKDIDYTKGSATGYIAKYISKNIDGGHLDTDLDGNDAKLAAMRVEAWASCWGIRQFQQIGGAVITPWRELRRLKLVDDNNPELAEIHSAADNGNFADYLELMGGLFVKRTEQAVRPLYKEEVNPETGQIKQSWYDGLITKKLKGIIHKGQEILTRLHTWQVEYVSQPAMLAAN